MGSKVSPVCPALRAELSSLLGRRRAAFDTLGHVQSTSQRVDALCAEVRGCVADSGLRYVDGELSHYEDGCYVPIRRDALMMTLANVLYSLGVGASAVGAVGYVRGVRPDAGAFRRLRAEPADGAEVAALPVPACDVADALRLRGREA